MLPREFDVGDTDECHSMLPRVPDRSVCRYLEGVRDRVTHNEFDEPSHCQASGGVADMLRFLIEQGHIGPPAFC